MTEREWLGYTDDDPFTVILDEWRDLQAKKRADYGRGDDPLANLRASEQFGIPAWVGVAVRMGDKLHRLASAYINGGVECDSVEDDFRDLGIYAAHGLRLYREQSR